MKSYLRLVLPAALAALLGATTGDPAYAWSMGGHRVTAVVAARELATTSPQVIDSIAEIMRAHPAAAELEARVREAGGGPAAQHERLFAEMAQWPDEVRRGPFKQFHRGTWHTIEIPYFAAGFKPAVEPQLAPENLLWALRENARIAADATANKTDRAVALCWLFHLVGDLHQPLHTISLYSEMFPDGDRYGSLFWVRPPNGDETLSLHYFWDSAVQRSQNMADVERTAARIANGHPRGVLEEMRESPYQGPATFESWTIGESHRLAITDGYRAGRLAGAADKRDALRLDEDYAANARAIAARRMTLAGYRLAEVLRAIFP